MDKPSEKYLVKEKECGASWEVKTSNPGYIVQCRICKVIVCSGGTPKCLKK